MFRGIPRVVRYGRSWLTGWAPVETRDEVVGTDGGSVPATLVLPRGRPLGTCPVWILLHGITRPGRAHPTLVRFSRALAASGAGALIPEVPEWIDLQLAPGRTLPTVRRSLDRLRELGVPDGTRVGLMGFSFGAPQAVIASGDPSVAGDVAAVVGFGGYYDLERTLRFQFTGRHEWAGETFRLPPDPYGRWIVGSNYLTAVPGYEGAGDVAAALHTLAADAGDRRVDAWDPALDALKEELAETVLSAGDRELFRLFAPPAGQDVDREAVEDLVVGLAEAARRVSPLTEPEPFLGAATGSVQLLHGRSDRLIPYSETLRLARRLGATVSREATVTALFSHSKGDPSPSPWEGLREGVALAGALRRILERI